MIERDFELLGRFIHLDTLYETVEADEHVKNAMNDWERALSRARRYLPRDCWLELDAAHNTV